MSGSDSLYQEIILDHNANPRHYGALVDASAVHHENPSCGDHIDLHVRVVDGRIDAIAFTSEGCAISRASASMMTEAVYGQPVAAAQAVIGQFREMMMHDGALPEAFEELESLRGVRKFPSRVKCAMLGWAALEKLLSPAG